MRTRPGPGTSVKVTRQVGSSVGRKLMRRELGLGLLPRPPLELVRKEEVTVDGGGSVFQGQNLQNVC